MQTSWNYNNYCLTIHALSTEMLEYSNLPLISWDGKFVKRQISNSLVFFIASHTKQLKMTSTVTENVNVRGTKLLISFASNPWNLKNPLVPDPRINLASAFTPSLITCLIVTTVTAFMGTVSNTAVMAK